MKQKNGIAEIRTVVSLKAGDVAAFDYFFENYSKELHHFSLKILKSKQDADEVVQEVFLRIWEKRDQINPLKSFRSYLFTIALNNIRGRFLKTAKENRFKVELYDELVSAASEEPEEKIFSHYLSILDELIRKLPERRKEIFLMHKKEGLTVPEVAGYLDLSPKTVENQLTAALKTLREAFNERNIRGLYLFFVRFCGCNHAKRLN
ncbi:MAG: RNA polymerase sigma-70 factor [Prolixibacteraceae bacterium]